MPEPAARILEEEIATVFRHASELVACGEPPPGPGHVQVRQAIDRLNKRLADSGYFIERRVTDMSARGFVGKAGDRLKVAYPEERSDQIDRARAAPPTATVSPAFNVPPLSTAAKLVVRLDHARGVGFSKDELMAHGLDFLATEIDALRDRLP